MSLPLLLPGGMPVGMFDSGVGGLTVVGTFLRRYPGERVLYVADQAHVPYGGRPLPEICGFASGISAFLAEEGCKAVVMACNISSAVAQAETAHSLAPLPVVGMIERAAQEAVRLAQEIEPAAPTPRIGVLATLGTTRSEAYPAFVRRFHPAAEVTQVACPKFVPLVEAELLEGTAAEAAAREYLAPLAAARCRVVVLGCTHYPFLMPTLRRVAAALFADPVAFLDPACVVVESLSFAASPPPISAEAAPSLLLTTGDPAVLRQQAAFFLSDIPNLRFDIGSAQWSAEGRLVRG